MIDYLTNPSPFYQENESFCKRVEDNLNTWNCSYDGFCSSYGYEINSRFILGGHQIDLKFVKHQTTRGGGIPLDAGVYSGVELTSNGYDPNIALQFGKNKIKRLFIAKKIKSILKSPFYFFSSKELEDAQFEELIHFFTEYALDSFQLKNGKIKLILSNNSISVFEMIPMLEKRFSNKF